MLLQHTDDCRAAFRFANLEAGRQGSLLIGETHILAGLASVPGNASDSMTACGIDLDELRQRASQSSSEKRLRGKGIVEIAVEEVRRRNDNHLDTGHVLLALVSDRDGVCAKILRAMDVDLDDLVSEIERRLPRPTFPLQQALVAFADDPRVVALKKQIDDAQDKAEAHIRQADFKTAALHRDKKVEVARELESLLEEMWNEARD